MRKMKSFSKLSLLAKQEGFMLLEALISILIFSIGILGIVALQALSITNSTENRYRITASLLANQLISQMWVDDRNPTNLATHFASGSSYSAYTKWLSQVQLELPAPTSTVTIASISATQSMVTIQIFWTMPDGAGHNYQVSNEITQFN